MPEPARVTPLNDLPDGSEIRATAGSAGGKNVVLIVNGNGFPASDYAPLAGHLAYNGFIAAIIRRPGGHGGDARFIVSAARTVLETLGLAPEDPEVKLALIGHSAAGALVVNAAAAETSRLPVRAVVALAPSALNSERLDGNAAGSYLLIYGSQDEDLTGFSDRRREAFRAYDLAGSEYSSTCNAPPDCFFEPPLPFEKTMIYIHGADHAGLVGSNRAAGGNLPRDTEYVTPADQLCVVKTYVAGFLRWKLMGEARFRPLVRGASEPAPVDEITTAGPDALDNPADSPLRLQFQISPAQRRIIENFQAGPGDYSHSRKTVVRHADAGELSADDHYVRHDTGLALVGWNGGGAARWAVPESARDGRTFTHFAFRAGQLHAAPAPYDNPEGQSRSFRLGLEDVSGRTDWREITGIAPRTRAWTSRPRRSAICRACACVWKTSKASISTTCATCTCVSRKAPAALYCSTTSNGTATARSPSGRHCTPCRVCPRNWPCRRSRNKSWQPPKAPNEQRLCSVV